MRSLALAFSAVFLAGCASEGHQRQRRDDRWGPTTVQDLDDFDRDRAIAERSEPRPVVLRGGPTAPVRTSTDAEAKSAKVAQLEAAARASQAWHPPRLVVGGVPPSADYEREAAARAASDARTAAAIEHGKKVEAERRIAEAEQKADAEEFMGRVARREEDAVDFDAQAMSRARVSTGYWVEWQIRSNNTPTDAEVKDHYDKLLLDARVGWMRNQRVIELTKAKVEALK